MNNTEHFGIYRALITRVSVIVILLLLIARLLAHTFPIQLLSPPLTRTSYDVTYVIYKALGIGNLLTQNHIAGITFNILIFGSGIGLCCFPRNTIIALLFSITIFILFINTNVYVMHSQHYLALLLICTFAFLPKKDMSFSLLWEGLRYYLCWTFASTFLLKLIYGAMWQWDYGMLIMQSQLATYLYQNPNTAYAEVCKWLMQHNDIINVGQKLVFVAEGIFILGFFTKKYDKILMLAAVFIFITTSCFADVFFVEQLLISLLILQPLSFWKQLDVYFRKGLFGSFAK